MEYQVPQFIEVEDKIFGPLSLQQFIFVAGGVGMCVALILLLPTFIGILLAIPVAGLSGALAFYKVNNKTFLEIIQAAITYYTRGNLYLWKKEQKELKEEAPVAPPPSREKLALTEGKLKELAWSLDIKDMQGPGQPSV